MKRPEGLVADFLAELDKHIADIAAGRTDVFFGVRDFAKILFVHPVHLSNTIKDVTGKAPCDHCEERLVIVAKCMLCNRDRSVAQVAARLTYDPPGFTRFFKKRAGITPTGYRKSLAEAAA